MANTPAEKIRECAGMGTKPTIFCMQGRFPKPLGDQLPRLYQGETNVLEKLITWNWYVKEAHNTSDP